MRTRVSRHKPNVERKADLIFTADIHIREDVPICRTDDFMRAQRRKLKFIDALQQEHDCPVLDAGDLFNHWKPSPFLLCWAIDNLPQRFITIPGNHDLPGHNLDLLERCGLGVLEAAGAIKLLTNPNEPLVFETKNGKKLAIYGVPYGSEMPVERVRAHRQIIVAHIMTYVGEVPFPGCKDPEAHDLLSSLEDDVDLLLTGHNHMPFVIEDSKGRLMINPGSLMRQKSHQIDYEPHVYLYFADDNTVEPVAVPISSDVISRDHIDRVKDKEARASAFVTSLAGHKEIGLSFEDNMTAYLAKMGKEIDKEDENLIWEVIRG